MAFECHEAWNASSGLADDAWDEEIISSSQVPCPPYLSHVKEAGVQATINNSTQKSNFTTAHVSCNTHCSFLDLPPVLIAEIFNRLNPRELSMVSCVCILFRRISFDSHGWKEFYCERWGLPAPCKPSESSSLAPEKSWRELYVEREARSKAFLGRFKVDVLPGHTEPIRSVCLLASSNLIFTAGYDTVVRMWNMEEGLLVDQSRPLHSTIRAIAADMEMLVVGGTEAFVKGWRAVPELPQLFDISGITGHSTEFYLRGHIGPITCFALDYSRIYSGSWDMTIRVWDRASLKCLNILKHGDWVWSLVARGPNVVSTAGSDMYTWNAENGQQLTVRLNVHVGNAYALKCSRSGHLLFTGGEDGAIHMFEDRYPRRHTSHCTDVFAINDKPVASWMPHSCPVYSLAFEDPWLVSASGDGKLAMMNVRKLLKLNSSGRLKSVTNNYGQWERAAIVTLQTEPPQRMLHGFCKNLYSVDIGAERIVCGGEERVVRIWDFTQALEIERRVQASRSIRLENRLGRKKVQAAILNKSKQLDCCTRVANSRAHILLDYRKLKLELQDYYQELQPVDMSCMLKQSICKQASMLTDNASRNTLLLQQMRLDDLPENCEMDEGFNHPVHDIVPVKSQFYVGLEKSTGDLRRLLFQKDVLVVGVQSIGGGGKTTLALAIGNDDEIKGYFKNVVFITVSQSPNVKGLIETIWDKIVGTKKPEFQNVEDARMQLQQQLQWQSKSTLVILDDVWSRVNMEKLLFQGEGIKTLVTTRDSSTIPRNHSTQLYHLPMLGHEDSLSLFCFWAFGQTSIPTNQDASLVNEVQAECKGLPLALKVIGSCLNGEPRVAWESARIKLSKRELISDYHRDGLFRCLETSISFLDDVARECFLDVGAFPEDKKICADALLHIWVYVRKLEWQDAFAILLELASRNLLNLTSNSRNAAEISFGNASELYVSQHDVMRDLALYLGGQGIAFQKKRLIMPRKENLLPGKWELLKDRSFESQIVSIYTGTMDKNDWYEINFPKTEALVILFAANEYHLPPFIKSMTNLKFLMVCNYSSKRATIKGLDILSSLPQLRSVRLERLVVPNLQKQSIGLHNLEKLSISLCEGFGSASTFNCTKLQEFNLDHCSDLEAMPPAICQMPSARIMSVTNCHLVQSLPCDLGNLSCLIMLRLSALPGLKELPSSIGKLVQLEYLDISVCEGLKELPDEIGKLKKLEKIDMRECSRLKRLPGSVCGLSSLKHVICDEKIEKQWLLAKKISIPELTVEIVEAQFSLDWLDD